MSKQIASLTVFVLVGALAIACQNKAETEKPKPAEPPAAPVAAAPAASETTYACPMHPEVTNTKPSKCPKCGMTLEPVKK